MKISINKHLSFCENSRPLIIAEISCNHKGDKKNFLHKIVPPAMGFKELDKILNHLTVACWTGVDTLLLH